MTRQEFIDEINNWWELIDFCNDEGCDYLDNVYTAEARDDYINDYQLGDWARDNSWRILRDILDDLYDGYEYYKLDDWGDWMYLNDEDFESYKSDVLDWARQNYVFDEDEEEDPADYGIEDEEVNDEEVEEPISMFELLSDCQDTYQKISEEDVDEGLDSLLIPA
jgi:hypothetical protein